MAGKGWGWKSTFNAWRSARGKADEADGEGELVDEMGQRRTIRLVTNIKRSETYQTIPTIEATPSKEERGSIRAFGISLLHSPSQSTPKPWCPLAREFHLTSTVLPPKTQQRCPTRQLGSDHAQDRRPARSSHRLSTHTSFSILRSVTCRSPRSRRAVLANLDPTTVAMRTHTLAQPLPDDPEFGGGVG